MAENLNNNITKEFKLLFANKEYQKAQDFLTTNFESFDPGVYSFNEGILFFKQERYLEARIKFEKAGKLGFSSIETTQALQKTKEVLGVSSLEKPSTKMERLEVELVTTSLDFFITVSLFFIVLSLIKKIKSTVRIICIIVAFIPILYFYTVAEKHVQKIALEDKSVFLGPSNMFEEIQLLPKGMVFITNEKLEGWTKIVFPTSHAGWIKNTDMESL